MLNENSSIESITKRINSISKGIFRLQSDVAGLELALAKVAGKLGLTEASVVELVVLCQNQAHSERLLAVEKLSSDLAAQIDTRSEHPPQLSDDYNYFDIAPEKPTEE